MKVGKLQRPLVLTLPKEREIPPSLRLISSGGQMEDEKDIGRGRKEVNNNGTKHHVLWFVGSCLLPFAIFIVQQTDLVNCETTAGM